MAQIVSRSPPLTSWEARRLKLEQSDEELFVSGQYSDVTVKRGSRSWKLHKNILCQRSTFFAKACSGVHKDDDWVMLQEGDPNAIHAMLEYLYTGDYDSTAFCHNEDYEAVRLDMLVFILAKKYDLPDLAAYASEGFADQAYLNWNRPYFAAVVEELYDFPVDPKQQQLRDTVVEVCVEHAWKIFAVQEEKPAKSEELETWDRHHPVLVDPPQTTSGYAQPIERDSKELRELAKSIPCFGGDLAAYMARNRCEECANRESEDIHE